MAENPQRWDEKTTRFLAADAPTIRDVASLLNLAPEMIAAPVAREINRANAGDDHHFLVQPIIDDLKNSVVNTQLVSQGRKFHRQPITDEYLKRDHEAVVRDGVTNTGWGPLGLIARHDHPSLNDLGPGKIQIGTAMNLVENYFKDPQFKDDPLHLAAYKDHPARLVQDLQRSTQESDGLTYKLAGLMTREAVNFYTDKLGVDRWNRYSDQDKAALVTTYYTQGRNKVAAVADDQIKKLGRYTPNVTGSEGGAYISKDDNWDKLRAVLGPDEKRGGGDNPPVTPASFVPSSVDSQSPMRVAGWPTGNGPMLMQRPVSGPAASFPARLDPGSARDGRLPDQMEAPWNRATTDGPEFGRVPPAWADDGTTPQTRSNITDRSIDSRTELAGGPWALGDDGLYRLAGPGAPWLKRGGPTANPSQSTNQPFNIPSAAPTDFAWPPVDRRSPMRVAGWPTSIGPELMQRPVPGQAASSPASVDLDDARGGPLPDQMEAPKNRSTAKMPEFGRTPVSWADDSTPLSQSDAIAPSIDSRTELAGGPWALGDDGLYRLASPTAPWSGGGALPANPGPAGFANQPFIVPQDIHPELARMLLFGTSTPGLR